MSNYLHCEKCLAYHKSDYAHVCPPWLAEIVRIGKQRADIHTTDDDKRDNGATL